MSMQVLKNLLADIICYVWRHKPIYNDCGCEVCGRCGKHEYYDNNYNNGKPIFKTIQFFTWKLYKTKAWYRRVILKELPF